MKFGKEKSFVNKKIFKLPNSSGSEKYDQKLNQISSYLKKKGKLILFITASENNAWMLNIQRSRYKIHSFPF